MYKSSFKEFVLQGINKYYIGTGNPNANILFIGKESALSENDIEEKEKYQKNANNWQNHILNNTCETLDYFAIGNNKGHNYLRESWGKNTWSKYQSLYDNIIGSKSEKYHINLLKNVFTTEINDAPNINTSSADKSRLKERKIIFKDSQFIQDFPVVVLACSNYIKNNNEIREIDEIFKVTYDGDINGKYYYSKGNWFFTHHNALGNKLVIHTRQLSADVSNKLLQNMAKIIKEHLVKYNLNLEI